MIELNKIYNEDCLEGMKKINSESIDLIVTDPPYRVVQGGRTSNVGHGGIFTSNHEGFKKGKIFDDNDLDFSEWLPELYRVLKKDCHCYIFINGRNLAEMQVKAEKTGFKFQNLLVWDKGNKTPNRYYMQQCEFILLLKKGNSKNITNMGTGNLLSFKNLIGRKTHPTEKPVDLLKVLIENSSGRNDIVLDCFSGSGSTMCAARLLERYFIGFEINESYYLTSLNNISAVLNENPNT